jgi:hypothetical protein
VPSPPLTIEQILTRLAEGPSRLAELTAGLTPAQLSAAPAPGEWSVNDVVAHLRASGKTWGEKINALLGADRSELGGGIEQRDHPGPDPVDVFRSYAAQRADLLAALEQLPPEAWSRVGIVTAGGRRYERTILYYADWMARHERPHIRQIERIVKSRE